LRVSTTQRARIAVTLVFALNGALFATIFSRLPAIQERTDLGEGALGLALLCSMFGLLASQAVSGALVQRLGSRPVMTAGALGYAVGLVPVSVSTSFAALAASLFLVGFSNGVLDVSMNIHGLTVERRLGRPILSTLHAAFSFGALAGAGVGGLVAAAGIEVPAHLTGAALLGALAILVARRFLLESSADAAPGGPMFAVPSGALLLVGIFAFCVLMAEGAVNDWAAVYLDNEIETSEAAAAAGLAAFSLTMGIGRLFGDRLNERLGAVRLARSGGALAAAGIATALLTGAPALAVAGFACAGIGLAGLFPLALRAAAARGPAQGPSVAAVTAFGYLGFLAGPPAIGGLAELLGLRVGLVLVVAVCLVAAASAPGVRAPRPVAASRSR
jgi:MFS family permease